MTGLSIIDSNLIVTLDDNHKITNIINFLRRKKFILRKEVWIIPVRIEASTLNYNVNLIRTVQRYIENRFGAIQLDDTCERIIQDFDADRQNFENQRTEAERIKDNKIEERNIVKLSCKNINGMNSNELEILTQSLEEYNQDSRIQCKIIDTKKELKRVKIEEYQKTEEYKKIQLQEEIKELKKQHYQEQLRLQDYHDAVLEKLKAEDTIIYDIEKLNKKEIEVLEKEEYKKTNEYDPIESKNKTFLVKQILNHSPSHTFLVARIKQLLEKHISHNSIRTHDTKDADLTFEINYKIYALEIEKGSLLTKKKSLRNKVSLLNNKYGQNWYFIVTNRNLTKKYRKYGKVTSRMGVRKIIEKLVKN